MYCFFLFIKACYYQRLNFFIFAIKKSGMELSTEGFNVFFSQLVSRFLELTIESHVK